jgi:hypothetical protein
LANYQTYMLNVTGQTVAVSHAEFTNDETALAKARAAKGPAGSGAEVWQGARRVGAVSSDLIPPGRRSGRPAAPDAQRRRTLAARASSPLPL